MKRNAHAEGFAGSHLNLLVLHRVLQVAPIHAQIHVSRYLRANRAGGFQEQNAVKWTGLVPQSWGLLSEVPFAGLSPTCT